MTDKPNDDLLTRDQIVELLQVAATYDRRTIGDADVTAWAHAAKAARWAVRADRGDGVLVVSNHVAVAAIRNHYAMSTAYLMPGHITEYIRNWRRQPPPLTEVAGLLPAAPPASDETRREAMEEMFGMYADRNFKPPEDAA